MHPNTQFVQDALTWLPDTDFDSALDFYEDFVKDPNCDDWTIGEIGKKDRFFLLTHLCGRVDAIHPWLYERCREVERNTDGYLDLWARDHYKSTYITFAGSIQEILNEPEITIGIFSHTRPIAKDFLGQIKREFELNERLKRLYPDILYQEPRKEAPTWSLDGGLLVKRKNNPKEKTVEAHGLVDGQPIGKHFGLLVFDDVVVRDSVNTPDQIAKTTEAWELAQNLGSSQRPRSWHTGTRYNFADTYNVLLVRNALVSRVYPATDDGTPDGNPVFLSKEVWEKKKRDSSLYTIACQQLQNPTAGKEQEFKPEYLRYYEVRPQTLNVYILCDYAGGRKSTGSSKTAMAVLGYDSARNIYLLDGMCHKVSLSERWVMLRDLHKRWVNRPGIQVVQVGYERFGAQTDIEHFETMMEIEGYHFPIDEVNWPRDGDFPKDNRIRRLEPDFRNWRIFLPYDNKGQYTSKQRECLATGRQFLISKPIKRVDEQKNVYDLVKWFISNEYLFFPATTQKDFLDAMSRIYDMDPQPPMIFQDEDLMPEVYEDGI